MNNHPKNFNSPLNDNSAKVINKINKALISQGKSRAKQAERNGSVSEGTNYFVDEDGEITYIGMLFYNTGDEELNLDFFKTVRLDHIKRFVLILEQYVSLDLSLIHI